MGLKMWFCNQKKLIFPFFITRRGHERIHKKANVNALKVKYISFANSTQLSLFYTQKVCALNI